VEDGGNKVRYKKSRGPGLTFLWTRGQEQGRGCPATPGGGGCEKTKNTKASFTGDCKLGTRKKKNMGRKWKSVFLLWRKKNLLNGKWTGRGRAKGVLWKS